jgi:hypothetical protein
MAAPDRGAVVTRWRTLIAGGVATLVVLGLGVVTMSVGRSATSTEPARVDALATSSDRCVVCHRKTTPGIVQQYGLSTMAAAGVAASVVVGVVGAYFHLLRAILPSGPIGQRVTLDFFFLAPPILGPLAFAFVGVFGTSAAWIEDPPGSGRLLLPAGLELRLPYPKSNAYFYVTAIGMLIALVSSVLDHAAVGFHHPWLWLPLAVGVFATVAALVLGILARPTRLDLWTYVAAMLLAILVGAVGAVLHVEHDLASGARVVPERLLRGAPFMAPLLFSNMGLVGLLALLPSEVGTARPAGA